VASDGFFRFFFHSGWKREKEKSPPQIVCYTSRVTLTLRRGGPEVQVALPSWSANFIFAQLGDNTIASIWTGFCCCCRKMAGTSSIWGDGRPSHYYTGM